MFVHPALTWGFFLALIPLLIHLINLVRRRRVKWAAMQFLLQSYKKHQKWIWLQQLLLLFLRMLVVVIAVAMLAQWIAKSHWLTLFGGQVTHHYVLLDDSFSMSERFGGVSAFDKATQSLSRIATQAMAQESPQKVTVLRFSRALGFRKDDTSTEIGQLADLNAELVDARFDVLLEEKRRSMEVTQLAVGPRTVWELTVELLRQSREDTNVVHVLSDFRHKDWSNPAELKQLLSEIDEASEQIQFVNCAPESQQTNLAVVDLRPADEIRAAGVPLRMNITVANYGTETIRKVPLRVRTNYYDPQAVASAEPGKVQPHVEEPPAVLIEELPSGQTTTRQVQVFFPRPGEHVVEAMLPEDIVAVDNRRWCVVNIDDFESVLAIDSNPHDKGNAYFLKSAFEPGTRAVTGIRVDVKDPSFLRDTDPETLAAYRSIYLLDVERLEDRAVANIESFVRAGGGLAVFVGGHVLKTFYTDKLYRGGEGFFPLPLEREETLPPDTDESVPDLDVTEHPLFSIFLSERNPFINLVNIDHYLRPQLTWSPEPGSTVSIIARLRNRRPFVVERRFGEGRVVVFLTTLAPEWNNWANSPSFVVVLLKLQSYIAAPLRTVDARLVGSPLNLPTDGSKYRKDVEFVVPGAKTDMPLVLKRTASSVSPSSPSPKDRPGSDPLMVTLPGTSTDDANASRSGIYEVWRSTVAGPLDVRRFAFNFDPAESDITQTTAPVLLANLAPIQVRVRRADELAFEMTEEAGFNRATWLMILLVAMLVVEQLLAYFASYHPVPSKGVAR